jgi:hypothetical protein
VPLLADTAVKVASWPKIGPHSLTGCPNEVYNKIVILNKEKLTENLQLIKTVMIV